MVNTQTNKTNGADLSAYDSNQRSKLQRHEVIRQAIDAACKRIMARKKAERAAKKGIL